MKFENIMVVMDGGEGSMAAANAAVDIAHQLGSTLHVVATVDTETLMSLLQRHILVEDERDSFEHELEYDAQRYLKHVDQLAARARVKVDSAIVRGQIHHSVIVEAERRKVGLIVIGAWSHSMLKRELIPRERQMILDGAHCSVLVVKGADGG